MGANPPFGRPKMAEFWTSVEASAETLAPPEIRPGKNATGAKIDLQKRCEADVPPLKATPCSLLGRSTSRLG